MCFLYRVEDQSYKRLFHFQYRNRSKQSTTPVCSSLSSCYCHTDESLHAWLACTKANNIPQQFTSLREKRICSMNTTTLYQEPLLETSRGDPMLHERLKVNRQLLRHVDMFVQQHTSSATFQSEFRPRSDPCCYSC
jgi:hypothetical protein